MAKSQQDMWLGSIKVRRALLSAPASGCLALGMACVYAFMGPEVFMPMAMGVFAALAVLQMLPYVLASRRRQGLPAVRYALEKSLKQSSRSGVPTGVLLIRVDDLQDTLEAFSEKQMRRIEAAILSRIGSNLRHRDVVERTEPGAFAVVLSSNQRLDLEAAIQLAKRLQDAIAAPIHLEYGKAKLSVSVGLCLSSRMRSPTAGELMVGVQKAVFEALAHGPTAIRSHSDLLQNGSISRGGLLADLDEALAQGDLRAHFQPQISARTGDITGFEALIRWHHPDRGLIPPVEFLPLLERTGEISRITEVMISQSLEALRYWSSRGVQVPRVGINFSTPELMNPNLVEHLSFELDRFGLSADRVAIEVLETVVAGKSDETIVRNLAGLADLGCCIDLDDFGTGHASITNIQRFSIERIKIDRSFVIGIADSVEQQNMVAAILTMADRLGLATLAEGVESEDERRLLTKLGCAHLQGFGIGRPMPLEDTPGWMASYRRVPVNSNKYKSATN